MRKHYFIWIEERHSTGIASIDSEHREIAARVNRIIGETDKGKPYGAVKELMDDMLLFVGEHFAHEERLMSEHAYPEMENHAEEHAKLIQQLNNLIKTDPKAALASAFLIDWMEQHALQDDMELCKHLISRGVS